MNVPDNLTATTFNLYGETSETAPGVRLRTPKYTFVDRITYNDITSNTKGVVLDELFISASLSDRMYRYVCFVDSRVKYIIGGEMCDSIQDNSFKYNLSETLEDKALLDIFNDRLVVPVDSAQPFYEILPVGDGDLLVIMENGFLNHITQSKIAASAFVLLCLSQLDRFKVDKSRLNKLYLNLAFIDSYYLLLKARLG